MGFFSKEKCSVCGKESRLLSDYASVDGTKWLCSDCEDKMNVQGFIMASYHYENRISYEAIQNYQKFYWQTTNMVRQKAAMQGGLAINFDDIIFNEDVVCFPEYKNLIIPTSDILLVVHSDVARYSDTYTDAFMVTFFTKNKTIPYYSMILSGRASYFSLTGKAKKYREAAFGLMGSHFKNLKYPIGGAMEIRKLIKHDPDYDMPFEKEKLRDMLFDVYVHSNKFKVKNAERKIADPLWAIQYFLNAGISVG